MKKEIDEIALLKEKLEQYEQVLFEKEQEINSLRTNIAEQNEELAIKQQLIEELEGKLAILSAEPDQDKNFSWVMREKQRSGLPLNERLTKSLDSSQKTKVSEGASGLPTKLPEKAPLKWSEIHDRNFDFSKISDEFLKRKINNNDSYKEEILKARLEKNPKLFFALIWQDYVDAGLLNQSDLRGKPKTKSRDATPGLDKTLFDLLYSQCSKEEFAKILPKTRSESDDIDRDLDLLHELGLSDKDLGRLATASRRRSVEIG